MSKHTPIVELNNRVARIFLKETQQYANFDTPPYFDFEQILLSASAILNLKTLISVCIKKTNSKPDLPCNYEGVNYTILTNKDGGFAWRPIQLIHPVLYVDLVNTITEKSAWSEVLDLFKRQDSSLVVCISMPVKSNTEESNRAETVTNWWDRIEQESLRKSLDFKFMFQTDVTNCYPSIYTHSLEWAFDKGGRLSFKRQRSIGKPKPNLGTKIDQRLRNMNYGQTIGIPQGSVLMDFIAEMVMAGTDVELTEVLKKNEVTGIDQDFRILRYRDDYRIFSNEYRTGHEIMKQLNTILYNWNMKMNSSKTSETADIISASIKAEKLEEVYIAPSQQTPYFQKEALRIYTLSKKYPNSGVIAKKLSEYFTAVKKGGSRKKYDHEIAIAIMTMIAYESPKYMPQVASIVSEIIRVAGTNLKRKDIIDRIVRKFKEVPNTDLIDVWLQRITDETDIYSYKFDSLITEVLLAKKDNSTLWNSDWLNMQDRSTINIVSISTLKDQIEAKTFSPIVDKEEFELYKKGYEW